MNERYGIYRRDSNLADAVFADAIGVFGADFEKRGIDCPEVGEYRLRVGGVEDGLQNVESNTVGRRRASGSCVGCVWAEDSVAAAVREIVEKGGEYIRQLEKYLQLLRQIELALREGAANGV